MILTEADLHAYNRGELSPEATRQLESDPLAMQDAARLRAIGTALRAEQAIPVVGRAETLDRLRARSAKGIGTPRWIWAAGVASVAGLILISIPPDPPDRIRIVQVAYAVPQSESRNESIADFAAAPSGPASASAVVPAPSATDEVSKPVDAARAPGATVPRGKTRSGPPLVLRVPNVEAARSNAEREAGALGARILTKEQNSANRVTLRFETDQPAELRSRLQRLEAPVTESPAPLSRMAEAKSPNDKSDRETRESRPVSSPAPVGSGARSRSQAGPRFETQSRAVPLKDGLAVTLVGPEASESPDSSAFSARRWLRPLGALTLALALLLVILSRRFRSR